MKLKAPCLLMAIPLMTAFAAEPAPTIPLSPPALPEQDGTVTIPAQEIQTGQPRNLTLHLRYPRKSLKNVTPATGLMLDLHNWGGTGFSGAPQPEVLANEYDLVVIGVDYYQSGDADHTMPYDFGYFQALDALRALHHVFSHLSNRHIVFDRTRIYAGGGSGGGNVSHMVFKFAPHTFACIVDLSGMASLTDDIAFNLPGGASLNARYSRDRQSPAYLSPGMQEIRDLGNPAHLALLAKWGARGKIVVIHGETDASCPAADKKRVVDAMSSAGLNVAAHFIAAGDIDGKLILNCGHALGNRTALLQHFAGAWLAPQSPTLCRLSGATDFERRETVAYPVTGGSVTISYAAGFPVLNLSP